MDLLHPLLQGPKRKHGKPAQVLQVPLCMVNEQLLQRLQTPKGGYDRDTLEALGVSWPPQKGWKHRIMGRRVIVEEKQVMPAVKAPKKSKSIPLTGRYTGPEPTSPEFRSELHGLLAPPRVTYRKLQ